MYNRAAWLKNMHWTGLDGVFLKLSSPLIPAKAQKTLTVWKENLLNKVCQWPYFVKKTGNALLIPSDNSTLNTGVRIQKHGSWKTLNKQWFLTAGSTFGETLFIQKKVFAGLILACLFPPFTKIKPMPLKRHRSIH
jgi:hypothetical protein